MSSPATTSPRETHYEPTDLAWRVIGLVNLYRLLAAAGLLLLSRYAGPRATLGIVHAAQLALVCSAYLAAGATLVLLRRSIWPNLRQLALTHVAIDAVAIGAILWSSGGVSSGLGVLLILPVGAMSLLAERRDAYFMAALAALAVLIQQIATGFDLETSASEYLRAGIGGTVLFLLVLTIQPFANRLRESEALARRQEVDLANMAQLSQYIVQHLRESLLVVDAEDRIRLINESAAKMLGDALAIPGALLGEASPRLLYLLATWRQTGPDKRSGEDRFAAADGARLIQPHFASLGGGAPGPVLVFLEDTSLLAEKVQQSKLAALGRLTASIAHEIRNPVGAMSHASQLLAESPGIADADRRLTQIIRTNGDRVSRIIENVLEFSRRGTSKPERLVLLPWLAQFRAEFCATLQLPDGRVRLLPATEEAGAEPLTVRVDPQQLHQVLWNLCQNAVTYGGGAADGAAIELQPGRMALGGRPYLEVADRGPGITPEDRDRIFEPFFTTSAQGTGLGLFLARELAQTNGATLLYEARSGGGSLFRLVFSDPLRWEP